MNENVKTLAFVAVSIIVVLAAYFIDAPTQAVNVQALVGKSINDDFEVDEPKRLQIIKFDRQTAETRQFEVAAIDGVWSIPSKQDYPADATQQMAAAANALIDRKILMVAGQTAESHEEFGVVDPQAAKLDAASTGVGTRVIMTDGEDKQLVDMIIGKKVKDSEGQRYVRKSNQDVVYVVELDPETLSTNFEDWIEDDLLKLSPFDIRRVFINDYSADLGITITPEGRLQRQVSWDRRGELTLTYDNDEAKWNVGELKKFNPGNEQMQEDKLREDEEVNQDVLGALRTGLDDLLIVDVARKPEGLSADLKAGEGFLNNQEAIQDLIDKGFSPLMLKPGGEPEILSSEGEVICTLRDGVEYVLRFGKLRVQTDSAADGDEPSADGKAAPGDAAKTPEQLAAEAAAKKPAGSADEKNLRRYLFVMARFNEDIVEKPKLKELPPLPEAAAATPAGEEPAAAETPADGGENAEATPEGDAAKAATPEAGGDEEATKRAAEVERITAERKAIEEENKRLQDEYEETIKNGKKRVAELNDRFGDWYYVISNDVFKQIHLGRDQVIRKKKPAEDAAAEGAAPGDSPLPGLPNLPLGGESPATEGAPAGEAPASPATPDATGATDGAAAPAEETPAEASPPASGEAAAPATEPAAYSDPAQAPEATEAPPQN